MRRDRGFLYMSEVDHLAMALSDYFSALVRSKIGGSVRRVAERDEEALRMEMIVDSAAHDSEESVVEAAVRLGDSLAESWGGATWLLGGAMAPPKIFKFPFKYVKKLHGPPQKLRSGPPTILFSTSFLEF